MAVGLGHCEGVAVGLGHCEGVAVGYRDAEESIVPRAGARVSTTKMACVPDGFATSGSGSPDGPRPTGLTRPVAMLTARTCQVPVYNARPVVLVVKYTMPASGVITAELICADAPYRAALTRTRLRSAAEPGAAFVGSR